MSQKKDADTPPGNGQLGEVELQSDHAEALFSKGLLPLSSEQLEALGRNPTIIVTTEQAALIPVPKNVKQPIEWIEPVDAVHLISSYLKDDIAAKRAIAERLRDQSIACTCVWTSVGPDVGPVTTRRPRYKGVNGTNDGNFFVSPIVRKPNSTRLGGRMWSHSDNWERDTQRWDWKNGLFLTSSGGVRMVAAGVRFDEADIARIIDNVTGSSRPNPQPENLPSNRGRKRKEEWNDFVAELVIWTHIDGIDENLTAQQLHDKIERRLHGRKLESLELATVEKAIGAVIRRWREAKNKTPPEF